MNNDEYTNKIINSLIEIRDSENTYFIAKISSIIIIIIAFIPVVISFDFLIENIKVIMAIVAQWIILAYVLNVKFIKNINIKKIDKMTMLALNSDRLIQSCFKLHCHIKNGENFLNIPDFLYEVNQQSIKVSISKTAMELLRK